MHNLFHSLWSERSATDLRERARIPHRAAYLPPMFGDLGCACGTYDEILDQCGNIPLLVDEEDIINNSFIDSNFDRKALRVALYFAQDILATEIGYKFMQSLYDWKVNQTPILDNQGNEIDEDTFIHVYLLPTLAYRVQADLAIPISYKEKNQGMVNIVGDTFNHAQKNDITYVVQWYNNKYEFYLKRLRRKLRTIGVICGYNIFPQTNIVL